MFRAIFCLVSSCAISFRVTAFTPCASPRFDVFAENMLGKWLIRSNEMEVTEVMRSCGGAVQGVREIAMLESKEVDDKGMYLNRANDGWAYWEDGSYSLGPTKLDGREAQVWTSLTVEEGKQRVLLLAEWTPGICTSTCSSNVLQSEPLVRPAQNSLEVDQTLRNCPKDTNWLHQSRCRMPSAAQPWMMQRAKWESVGHAVDTRKDCQIQVWIDSQQGEPSQGSVTVGICCLTSGYSVAIRRDYQANGNLASITYLRGASGNAELSS